MARCSFIKSRNSFGGAWRLELDWVHFIVGFELIIKFLSLDLTIIEGMATM